MKNFIRAFLTRTSIFAFVLLAVSALRAQEPPADQAERQQKRPSLLQQLDLSPTQIQQIRVVNRETRDRMRTAAQRQREARRALDAAIYDDDASENEIERCARELADAQAEVTKLRAATEFRIRQTLNAGQLARFRELRRRAVERTDFRQERRRAQPLRPNKRFPLRNQQ